MPIYYKGDKLSKEFVVDFLAFGKIIIELKCIPRLTQVEDAQIIHYLKASGMQLGLLINFGTPTKLDWKRIVRTNKP